MAQIELRRCLNAISDVVSNRPRPLREYDQIFMKSADMLLQTEHVSRAFDGKRVVFVGDGDAIGLCLVHLHNNKLIEHGPKAVHILDFDERIVFAVRSFAENFNITDRVQAELYNVADPLPESIWQTYDAFYTNPPFGASNGGRSVDAFIDRAVEAVGANAIGCIVVADHPEFRWTQDVLRSTQRRLLDSGFVISELLPEFHHYHLDDSPELTSCSVLVRRLEFTAASYASLPLPKDALEHFYGDSAPLRVRYIRDKTHGGKLTSSDHRLEQLEE